MDTPDGLTLEESNNARLQALNSIGVGVNGINEGLVLMMLEELLGDMATKRVKQRHQEWLAEQLDAMEEKVQEAQAKQAEEMRKAQILRPGMN